MRRILLNTALATMYVLILVTMDVRWIVLDDICSNPSEPNPATGHTNSYNCHGATVFITSLDQALLHWLTPVGIFLIVGTALIALNTEVSPEFMPSRLILDRTSGNAQFAVRAGWFWRIFWVPVLLVVAIKGSAMAVLVACWAVVWILPVKHWDFPARLGPIEVYRSVFGHAFGKQTVPITGEAKFILEKLSRMQFLAPWRLVYLCGETRKVVFTGDGRIVRQVEKEMQAELERLRSGPT